MPIPTGDIIIGFKVQGVGKVSAVPTLGAGGAQWRFTTGAPSSSVDPQGLYKAWILQDSLPSIEFSADHRTGRFTIGSPTWKILEVSDDSDLRPRDYFSQTTHTAIGKLGAVLVAGVTNVVLSGATSKISGLDGVEIGVGTERIRLGTEGSTGVYSGCERGIHGTIDQDHDYQDPTQNVAVYRSFHQRPGRLIEAFYLPEGATALSEEVTFWAGVILTCGQATPAEIEIHTRSITSILSKTRILPDAPKLEVSAKAEYPAYLRGQAASDQLPAWVDLRPSLVPGAFGLRLPYSLPSSPTSGDPVWVMLGGVPYAAQYRGGGTTAGLVLRIPDVRAPLYQAKALKLEDVSVGDIAHEFFAVDASAPGPDDGDPLGGSGSDVLTAVLEVMCSTRHGNHSATYDRGVDFGIKAHEGLLDVDSFDVARARIGIGTIMPRTFFGATEKPEMALDKIEQQILHPLDLVFTDGGSGLLGLAHLRDRAEPNETLVSITQADLVSVVSRANGDDRIINTVEASHRRSPGGKSRPLSLSGLEETLDSVLGVGGSTKFEGGGWASSASALERAVSKLQRWSKSIAILGFEVLLSKDVPVGKLCELTCDYITSTDLDDSTLLDGLTEAAIHIVSKAYNLSAGTISYVALHTSDRLDRLGEITPAAEVSSWDAGTLTATVEEHAFTHATEGLYDSDAEAFAVGDELVLVDEHGTQLASGFEVTAITSTTLVLDAAPSPAPSGGDYLIWAGYNQQTAAQKLRGISIADSGGVLGSGNESGFRYEG